VLGAAKLLSLHRDLWRGTVKFIFQPDEEGSGGAMRLIESGALDGVEAVYGGHVDPNLPLGTFGVKYGKFYAASDVFHVGVVGIGTHGATPEKGRSALLAAVDMVKALSLLKPSSSDRFVLSIGTLQSGSAGNIIPEKAEFSGILRTLGPENRREMKDLLKASLARIAEEHGVSYTLKLRESYGGIVNTDPETRTLETSLRETFGDEKVVLLEEPTMTTEDFGYYTEAVSGSFFHLGAGCEKPLHNPSFLPDPMVPVYGATAYFGLVEALSKGFCR
ncbi:MAG: amidohydrolase, partial [Spirochaetales bacterium]|nr:amidohydrolase [Candidatus Physcosoma equi]